jgi:(4S)-4-hydroxy-5-phosphonooxypentane-2,3-dione isomerase
VKTSAPAGTPTFVVVVDLEIVESAVEPFMALLRDNAAASLASEPGCRQFDVCVDPEAPASVLLYEVYDDRAAFDDHLKQPHFTAFDADAAPFIASKRVRMFQRAVP